MFVKQKQHPSKVVCLIMCVSILQPHIVHAQTAESLHLAKWRRSEQFAYIRQYFPRRDVKFDNEKQMTAKEKKSTSASLTRALAGRSDVARTRLNGIRILLRNTTTEVPNGPPASLKLDLQDDGNIWFHAIAPDRVKVGTRTIRGLMKGSLQSLRVELPRDSSGWDSSSKNSFFGAELLGDDSATISDEEWDRRFAKLMTVIEKAKIRSMLGTAWSLMTDDDFDDDDDFGEFDFADADEYISGEKKMSISTAMEVGAAMVEFSPHYLAAERFMLSHELGHLALSHNITEQTPCEVAQKAEDDADAFALALMLMDDSTGTAAILTDSAIDRDQTGLFAATEMREFLGIKSDDYSVVYGYRDFTDFIFKAAEFSGNLKPGCDYRTPADRRAFIDNLRTDFYGQRKAALGVVLDYQVQHPPMLKVQISDAGKTAKEDIYAYLEADRHCAGVETKKGSRKVSMRSSASFGETTTLKGTEYFIKCKWPTPAPSLLTQDQMALVGSTVWSSFVKSYAY